MYLLLYEKDTTKGPKKVFYQSECEVKIKNPYSLVTELNLDTNGKVRCTVKDFMSMDLKS